MVDPESNAYPALDAPAGAAEDNLTLFVCPACGQRARVPKMFAGHSIKCPGCKTSQSVAMLNDQSHQGGTIMLRRPQEVTDAIAAEQAKKDQASSEAAKAELADQAALANATPATGAAVVLPPTSGAALVMPPPSALVPKNAEAKNADPAPEFSPLGTPPSGSNVLSGPTIPFHCTKCLTESTVPAEYAGKVIKCPKCQAVQIALSGVAPMTGMFVKPSAKQMAAAVAADAAPSAVPTLAGAPAKTAVLDERGRIVFTCSACRFSAYFAQTYGGKPIQCPACGTGQTIDPLPGQMITPTTSAAAAAQAGSGSGAAPVIGAGGVVISSGRPLPTAPATTPGSGRINSPAPGTMGGTGRINSPAPHPVTNPPTGGTGRINSPAPQSSHSGGGTGRVPNSKFNTPLPGSLTAPQPGQALTSRHKMPPPPTPMPPMTMPPPAPPSANVPALSQQPGSAGVSVPPSALVPIVTVPSAPVIVHVPGPAPKGLPIALGVICVGLLALMAWMMTRSTVLATQRDDLATALNKAQKDVLDHDSLANDKVSAALTAKSIAEHALAAEHDAHQRDTDALAAATQQLAAAKDAVAKSTAAQTDLQNELIGRKKVELEMLPALAAPDAERAKLIDQMTQLLVQEVAARNAAEEKLKALGATAAATAPDKK